MILFLLKLLKKKRKTKKPRYSFFNESIDYYKLVKSELNKQKINPKNYSDRDLQILISKVLTMAGAKSISAKSYGATTLFVNRYRKDFEKNNLKNTNMRKIREVKISSYNRKANKVKEHFRKLDESAGTGAGSGLINIIDAIGNAKPEVKTTIAIDETTSTILKNISYTLAGAIVLGAIIRLKAK
jgi:alpha-galactosidase/6-phospho-beta-glucosidase family protein